MRINYVIATWHGGRGQPHLPAVETMDRHLSRLRKTPHHLSQITVVNPKGAGEDSSQFTSIQHELELDSFLERQEDITVLVRENRGMSYGSWLDAYIAFPGFDYYIFTEDDYTFVLEDFDAHMVSSYEEAKTSHGVDGYLCGLLLPWNCPPYFYQEVVQGTNLDRNWSYHPAVSWGITSGEALRKIISTESWMSHSKDQYGFGWLFSREGMFLEDVSSRYQIVFDHHYHPEIEDAIQRWNGSAQVMADVTRLLESQKS